MAFHLMVDDGSSGTAVEDSLTELRAADFVYSAGYSHPTELRFKLYQPQYSMVLPLNAFVIFWDDSTDNYNTQANPLFEGHIADIDPSESNVVEYTCFDPTAKAGEHITVMSTTWSDEDTPDPTAVPRLIVNSWIDNDEDYAFERSGYSQATVADIIQLVFDDAVAPLRKYKAAPPSGDPYTSADFSGATFVPQEKFVSESETIRSCIDRLLAYYPQSRILFDPGSRKWRIHDLTAAGAETLTLNDIDGTEDILSMQLDRSMDGRTTAVEIFGPETTTPAVASTLDGSLNPIGDQYTLELLGAVNVVAYTQWQIDDATKRRMSRILPTAVQVPVSSYFWVTVRSPTLQMSWDGGTTWITPFTYWFDWQNGIVSTGTTPVYIYHSEGQLTPTGMQHFFPPTNVRMVYAYYDTPLSIRKPTSSYEGTAFSVGGLESTKRIYDESLSIGFRYGTPVTSATRLTQFGALAQQLLNDRKDIAYSGVIVFDGVWDRFARLNKAVNINGVDGNGDAVTTGWEAIAANVTDCEIDFEQGLTTITINSDRLELAGHDIGLLKQRLKIRAVQIRVLIHIQLFFREVGSKFTFHPGRNGFTHLELAGVGTTKTTLFGDNELGFEAAFDAAGNIAR